MQEGVDFAVSDASVEALRLWDTRLDTVVSLAVSVPVSWVVLFERNLDETEVMKSVSLLANDLFTWALWDIWEACGLFVVRMLMY